MDYSNCLYSDTFSLSRWKTPAIHMLVYFHQQVDYSNCLYFGTFLEQMDDSSCLFVHAFSPAGGLFQLHKFHISSQADGLFQLLAFLDSVLFVKQIDIFSFVSLVRLYSRLKL